MAKRKRPQPLVTWGFVALVLAAGAVAFSSGVATDPASQVAVGAMADMMCASTARDASCPCQKGIDPRTGRCGNVRGGGKIGCPCHDVTAGQVAASGKCAQVGKCLADQAGGMMPMLPMIPMMMPMMMPSMPSSEFCPPNMPNASSTQATSTHATSSDPWGNRGGLVPCDPYGSVGSNLWSNTYTDSYAGYSDMTQTDFTADVGTGPQSSQLLQQTANVLNRLIESIAPGTGPIVPTRRDAARPLPRITATTTVHVDFSLLPGEIAPVTPWETGRVAPGWTIWGGAYGETDPGRAFGESTFSYTQDPEGERGILEHIASTLRAMLATMRGWTQ